LGKHGLGKKLFRKMSLGKMCLEKCTGTTKITSVARNESEQPILEICELYTNARALILYTHIY